MVNGIKKIYRVKVISQYGYGSIERDFDSLKTANKWALSLMLFDLSVSGKLEDTLTITEIEEKENKEND